MKTDNMTFAEFDAKLHHFRPGDRVQLSALDCERFFGANDAAQGRIRNFARGNACMTIRRDERIEFVKLPDPVDAKA